jgi:hypothetical protein
MGSRGSKRKGFGMSISRWFSRLVDDIVTSFCGAVFLTAGSLGLLAVVYSVVVGKFTVFLLGIGGVFLAVFALVLADFYETARMEGGV